jgi:diacylglycerol kinase
MLKDKTPVEPADPPVGRASNLLTSFGYAFQGIAYTLRTQRNMKIHLALGLAAMLLALWLQITAGEWAALLVAIALVYTLEMANTVVEAIVDLASPQYHPLAKVAKDVAAGAVLVAAFFAVAVGAFLFLPRLVGIFLPLIVR